MQGTLGGDTARPPIHPSSRRLGCPWGAPGALPTPPPHPPSPAAHTLGAPASSPPLFPCGPPHFPRRLQGVGHWGGVGCLDGGGWQRREGVAPLPPASPHLHAHGGGVAGRLCRLLQRAGRELVDEEAVRGALHGVWGVGCVLWGARACGWWHGAAGPRLAGKEAVRAPLRGVWCGARVLVAASMMQQARMRRLSADPRQDPPLPACHPCTSLTSRQAMPRHARAATRGDVGARRPPCTPPSAHRH